MIILVAQVELEDGEIMEVGRPVRSPGFHSGELREGLWGEIVCDMLQGKNDRPA